MPRLPLFKVLSCSLLALSLIYREALFAGNLTKRYEDAQSFSERRNVVKEGIRKLEDRLGRENNQVKVNKLEAKLTMWKERLEDIEKKKESPAAKQASELSHLVMNINQNLVPEILVNIFQHLRPKALSRIALVCKYWKILSDEKRIWKIFLRKTGFEIPVDLHPKVIVTSALKANNVNAIIEWGINSKENDRLVLLGYKKAIIRKIIGLASDCHGYIKDKGVAKSLNEQLVAEGNPKAIERKLEGLANGWGGYEEDPEAAKSLNEELVAQGNSEAIARKAQWIATGEYGYEKDPEAAKSLNEKLIAQGNSEAITRKVIGHAYGSYGYKQVPEFLTNYIELLIN